MAEHADTAEKDTGLTDRLYRAIVLDFEGRGEAWTTDGSGDTLAHAAAVVAEREVRSLLARGRIAEGKIAAAAAVLAEYERSCDPAPFTSERALYERLRGVIPPGVNHE